MEERSFISSFRSFRQWPGASFVAVFLFVATELCARLLWTPAIVGSEWYRRLTPSYDYGYASDTPRPFARGDRHEFYPTEYANIRRFSLTVEKPGDAIRVFTLGGSVSRGSGLQPGAEYSARLEKLLNRDYPEYQWEVVNLSADGFGTTRMLLVLRNMLSYRPDLLIIHPHGTNEFEDEEDWSYREDLHSGLNGILLRSRSITLLKKIEAHFLDETVPGPGVAEREALAESDPENVNRWMRTMTRNLDRISCIAAAIGTPVLFVGRAERDAPGFEDDRVQRLNGPIQGAPHYLDVAALFRSRQADSPLFFDNTHYSALGHELVAQALLGLVRPGTELFEEMKALPARTIDPSGSACEGGRAP